MNKSAYSVGIENARKNFNKHYNDFLECSEHKNTEGANFHSGAMLGIADCLMDFYGDTELYSRWCSTFRNINTSLNE